MRTGPRRTLVPGVEPVMRLVQESQSFVHRHVFV